MSRWMWQVASGSMTMHALDTDAPGWRNADGSRRNRSGPRARCGRYPQRNADGIWLEWSAYGGQADGGSDEQAEVTVRQLARSCDTATYPNPDRPETPTTT